MSLGHMSAQGDADCTTQCSPKRASGRVVVSLEFKFIKCCIHMIGPCFQPCKTSLLLGTEARPVNYESTEELSLRRSALRTRCAVFREESDMFKLLSPPCKSLIIRNRSASAAPSCPWATSACTSRMHAYDGDGAAAAKSDRASCAATSGSTHQSAYVDYDRT